MQNETSLTALGAERNGTLRPRVSRRGRPRKGSQTTPPEAEAAPTAEEHELVKASAANSISTLQLYLREVGRVKLLTAAEELELARRVQAGDEQAREQMIQANLRLVVKIAREYENLGLPLLDLINEGNMGLMKGVERFDPNKGAKLSTYASWWIKQAIKRALANQSKTIRLPVHVVDAVAHIRRAELQLKEVLDREPTDEELAEAVELKPSQVREYRDAAKATLSLDAPIGDENDSQSVSDVVADERADAPFELLARDSDRALMKEAFATLRPREQEVLSLRFGLTDDTPQTLEEISHRYGLTRERIRQIESEGLKKLRCRMAKKDRLTAETITVLAE